MGAGSVPRDCVGNQSSPWLKIAQLEKQNGEESKLPMPLPMTATVTKQATQRRNSRWGPGLLSHPKF